MPSTADANSYRWGTITPDAIYHGTNKIWPTAAPQPTVIWDEQFTGTWSNWTKTAGGGGTNTVTAGVGVLANTGADWTEAGSVTMKRAVSSADFEITARWRVMVRWSMSFGTGLRVPTSDTNVDPMGVVLWVNPDGTWQINERTAGSEPELAHPTMAKSDGEWHRYRIRYQGNNLKVRIWKDSVAEPSTWGADVTTSAYTAAGSVAVRNVGGNASNRSVEIDYFTVTTL